MGKHKFFGAVESDAGGPAKQMSTTGNGFLIPRAVGGFAVVMCAGVLVCFEAVLKLCQFSPLFLGRGRPFFPFKAFGFGLCFQLKRDFRPTQRTGFTGGLFVK